MSPDLRNHGSMEAKMLDECWAGGCMGRNIPWLSQGQSWVGYSWAPFLLSNIYHQSRFTLS